MIKENLNIPLTHRIFCNRSMNFEHIKCVGFDMDYTLAEYRPETFEALAYRETLTKLVSLGYPRQILTWEFDWKYMIRGLAIDKINGNIIKLDRHRYVKVAYHGFKHLSRNERRALYDATWLKNFPEPNFALIDTLFTLADAYLFAQLVDYKDRHPDEISKSYLEIYNDVRAAIDLCHRDGSIKRVVAHDPSKYIKPDPHLVGVIKRLRESGRKLFILTNSYWEYTNVVMNALFGNKSGKLNLDWAEYFDVVITGSAKPDFFLSRNPLYQVEPSTGFLKNTDDIMGDGKFYQGGNVRHLAPFLKTEKESEVLYVGDHIYGDILRSKKDLGWRTMLIVPELEKELHTLDRGRADQKTVDQLLKQTEVVDERLLRAEKKLAENSNSQDRQSFYEEIGNLRHMAREAKEALRTHLKNSHKKFHPVWGQLLKTGHQNSRFAEQMENYACLYTSRVSNLQYYSFHKIFRSSRDEMPHDFV